MAIRIDPALHAMPQRMQDEFRHEVAGTRRGPIADAVLPLNAALLDRQARIDRLERENEVLRGERDQARARVDYAGKLLTGVHALLYPAPVTTADGRTMVFRPTDPDPHEVLQELSDRIRALPDELEKAASMRR